MQLACHYMLITWIGCFSSFLIGYEFTIDTNQQFFYELSENVIAFPEVEIYKHILQKEEMDESFETIQNAQLCLDRESIELFLNPKETKAPINPITINAVLSLQSKLSLTIFGQTNAIETTVDALLRYAVGINDPNVPIANLLYVGPTGVGKTQLAKSLAKELFGSENRLIRLDMSEYSFEGSVTKLIGSPPGYVNHEQGGQFTEALKKNAPAVILLDEIEKAHPLVLKTFLQVFDEGRITDSKGVLIDCREVIFILTTNLAAKTILDKHKRGIDEDIILETIRPKLIAQLTPELYNRLEPVLFVGLNSNLLDNIVSKMLVDISSRLKTNKKISLTFDGTVVEFLKDKGFDYELGARPLKRLIEKKIVSALAYALAYGEFKEGQTLKMFYQNESFILKKMQ